MTRKTLSTSRQFLHITLRLLIISIVLTGCKTKGDTTTSESSESFNEFQFMEYTPPPVKPPSVRLIASSEEQTKYMAIQLLQSSWEGFGDYEEVPLPINWPQPLPIPTDSSIKLLFLNTPEPSQVQVEAYSKINADGLPEGRTVFSCAYIHPNPKQRCNAEKDDESEGWAFKLSPPKLINPLYLTIWATWPEMSESESGALNIDEKFALWVTSISYEKVE